MQYIGIKNLDIRNYGVSDDPGVNRQDWDQGENGDIHKTRSWLYGSSGMLMKCEMNISRPTSSNSSLDQPEWGKLILASD